MLIDAYYNIIALSSRRRRRRRRNVCRSRPTVTRVFGKQKQGEIRPLLKSTASDYTCVGQPRWSEGVVRGAGEEDIFERKKKRIRRKENGSKVPHFPCRVNGAEPGYHGILCTEWFAEHGHPPFVIVLLTESALLVQNRIFGIFFNFSLVPVIHRIFER